jgi:phosphonate transport system permease protein
LGRYSSLDWTDAATYGRLLLETIVMAIWGTLLAMAIGIPSTLLASRDLSPNPTVRFFAREGLNFFRAMPDAILALIFVSAFGLGPIPGALALGLHMAGFLGKVLSDSIERLPRGTSEGVLACGATRLQLARFAYWPSIDREILGYGLYLLDRNIRIGATLGFVGAGGIGIALKTALSRFDEPQAGAMVLPLVVVLVVIESSSSFVRGRLS